ncbi:hypothetical protein BJ138DRAFT_1007018, partial [Hygrophoropsis aurantiaca]
QHYLWAGGHFILLAAALRYFIAWITFKTISVWWYKASFFGALLSYAIVCNKSLGTPQPSMEFIQRALMDENVQYFILAFFWWTSKPVAIALIPYTIFSLFHALTFTRTTLMPQFLPPQPSANGAAPQPHPLSKRLQSWVKANYDPAMRLVAFTELLILVRVLLGAVTFRNSLLAPLVFIHFLRQRYFQSAFTREAIAQADVRLTGLVQKSGNPTVINVWSKARDLSGKFVGNTIVPQQPAAGARRD